MPDQALFLLAEDDANDALLLQRAFHKANILNPLHRVRTGEEAIAYLSGKGPYKNRAEFPLPSLVLLDLKMPEVSGFEVLKWIRQHPSLRDLRVVVLSGSEDMRDVDAAYKLGANSFLIKPADFERFVEISQALSGYWIWMDTTPEIGRKNNSGQKAENGNQSGS